MLPCDGLRAGIDASYRIPGPPLVVIAIFRCARHCAFGRDSLAAKRLVAMGCG